MLIDFAVSLAVFLIFYFILLKSSRLLLINLSRVEFPEKSKGFSAS